MIIYTAVTTDGEGLFGSYSSIKRARKAIEHYFYEATDVISFEDIGNYCYQYTTIKDETFTVSILQDTLDWEYENGELED